jgi:hypothetical protein
MLKHYSEFSPGFLTEIVHQILTTMQTAMLIGTNLIAMSEILNSVHDLFIHRDSTNNNAGNHVDRDNNLFGVSDIVNSVQGLLLVHLRYQQQIHMTKDK